jgi:hypothetical protein
MTSSLSVPKRSFQRLKSFADKASPGELYCRSGEAPELNFPRVQVIEFDPKTVAADQ